VITRVSGEHVVMLSLADRLGYLPEDGGIYVVQCRYHDDK